LPELSVELPSVVLEDLLIGLAVGAVLSALLAWHFAKFGRTMANRSNLAHTLPLITLTIVLIITVVKSSIALSLGLVGALSIVRFRTPIKEPEELAYLFVAIAIGLGLGAGQVVATITATAVILAVATARKLVSPGQPRRNLYLNIDIPDTGADGSNMFERISDLLAPHVESADLRRLDLGDGVVQATLYIKCRNDEDLVQAIESLKGGLPSSTTVTFIDQDSSSGA
jgi:uncharacterized membrane protein YhiD involved in acid resistance